MICKWRLIAQYAEESNRTYEFEFKRFFFFSSFVLKRLHLGVSFQYTRDVLRHGEY